MPPRFSFKQFILPFFSLINISHETLSPRLDNGLAITPPMGWNSYNHYSCAPNETIIHSNAQALVNLGLQTLGYHYVTVDCGWTLPNRAENGTLTWNPARFPSGYFALGDFIHSLGLGFGVYQDAGIQTCMTGEPTQVGSLFHEDIDAETFASWGADLLKYDDCYSEAAAGYPNVDYTPVVSPSGRYANMTAALLATKRPFLFQICNWGVDFPALWAPALGNSWRATNDIIPAYRTISRILNQVVPQTDFAGPGHWVDLDMLEVGNDIFTIPEEQTHFSLWAILKSPLVIGAALKDTYTSIPTASLAILKNQDVIGYNQDSLGVSASFRRRWTEEGYEIWAGPLSESRVVVALINLQDEARSLTVDFPDVGVQKAGSVKDIWNGVTSSNVLTSYTANVAAHGTLLLELGELVTAGIYNASDAVKTGQTTTFEKVFGLTTSQNYSAVLTFANNKDSTSIVVNGKGYTLEGSSLTVPLGLNATNSNTVNVTSSISPNSLSITPQNATFYPSTSFTTSGSSDLTTCYTGLCQPVGSKIGYLSATGSASLSIPAPYKFSSASTVSKYVDIYFCNNDIAFATSWDYGTNTRNMTITVNSVTTRVELPLSGRSSELFSPGLGWEDTGLFGVLLDGWTDGNNEVVVGNVYGNEGLVNYAADFVGLGIYW
ncbi:carbohydrate-binding module family 35 protein [Hyaloscypha variabilis F]|uniref:Alpha-galactosidase n=1 Tax=Hyaloscypha variabilis (strain UAMH 11265 / GT02V1 / F) TaxID=1149755 RepID=A0A2J6S5F6_HYAVF|nr:carbohydrate-binding module family 35 protein [Hyaloscypha variabilis F]